MIKAWIAIPYAKLCSGFLSGFLLGPLLFPRGPLRVRVLGLGVPLLRFRFLLFLRSFRRLRIRRCSGRGRLLIVVVLIDVFGRGGGARGWCGGGGHGRGGGSRRPPGRGVRVVVRVGAPCP